MAAGLGTRLRPYTDLEPKALLPLLGVPVAQFGVDALVGAGVSRIVANIHHLPERARTGLQALDLAGASLTLTDESACLLGSGGGIRNALPELGQGPFFILNADVLCDVNLKELAKRHVQLRAQWGVTVTLAIFPEPPGTGRYREILLDHDSGLITGLGEVVARKPFFVGAAVMEPEALEFAPKAGPCEFVPSILIPALERKKAGFFLTNGNWFDVGSPELWLDTHIALIERLETGALASHWRKRVEQVSRRAGQKVWIAKDSPLDTNTSAWAGPCYWGARGDETASPPQQLGPHAVLYGFAPPKQELSRGIGLQGVWVRAG